jgi:UDP-N-acetyl-D-galactosamine dehydrogenase
MYNFQNYFNESTKITVVGMGYVGLPLAITLSKKYQVFGFDINPKKISELKEGVDMTGEVDTKAIKNSSIEFFDDHSIIKKANFIIAAIPTPVDSNKKPDLTLLLKASQTIGENLAEGSVVVYESTVYPGATEDECLPILEKYSGLKAGEDFKIGYSPERVNPGDKEHTIEKIVKVVSGMDKETLDIVDKVYGGVVTAGTWRASSIKVAEAAKVIENTQRDLNIALVNELAIIFNKIGISTHEVLEAAGTKWNFLKFWPGLVGGHCIGVDPYYLTYKAISLGYNPEVILAGRKINDNMGKFIAQKIIKEMVRMGKQVNLSRIAILGITFKENIPDVRNSKVFDIYKELVDFGLQPLVYDPIADKEEVKNEYGINLCNLDEIKKIDTLIIAVPHKEFKEKTMAEYKEFMNGEKNLIVDIKNILNKKEVENLNIKYWTL